MGLKLNAANGGGSVELDVPNTVNSDVVLTLPDTDGTSGQYLQTDGSGGLSWSTSGLPDQVLTLGTSVASTSGTSIDFTSIPSTVKRITVMLNGVSTSGSSFPLIQIGSGSVSTSGYTSASGRTNSVDNAAIATSTAGFVIMNSGAGNAIRGLVSLLLLGSDTWIASGVLTDSSSQISMTIGGSSGALAGTLDRIRITTVNGTDTFDAGSINILYEG